MEEIMQMRENPILYMDMFLFMVQRVVGHKKYVRHVIDMATRCDWDLATSSGEALTLILLKNSCDHWVDLFKHNNYKRPEAGGLKSNHERTLNSKVKTKFTNRGTFYPPEEGTSGVSIKSDKPRGWSEEGIAHFKKLHDLVLQSRCAIKNKQ